MAKGKTKSKYSLSERRRRAYDLFVEGWTNADVARELKVSEDTAARYRAYFRDKIAEQAVANPQLLTKTLENTLAVIAENDRVRQKLWEGHREATQDRTVECPNCEAEIEVPHGSHSVANQYLSNLIKAEEQRAKLLNLFGVKQEVLVMVNNVKIVQDKILEFLARELCNVDRDKLDNYITSELSQYINNSKAIEATVISQD